MAAIDGENQSSQQAIGARITRAREAAGLSSAQMARRLGIKTQTLNQWEAGKGAPRSNRLAMLAGLLNVSPGWLLVGRGTAPAADLADSELRMLKAELAGLRAEIDQIVVRLDRIIEEFDRFTDDAGVLPAGD